MKFITFFLYQALSLALCVSGKAAENKIDEYDKICVDHVVMAIHAFSQDHHGKEVDLSQSMENKARFLLIPYTVQHHAVSQEILKGWEFTPFHGKTGFKTSLVDWRKDTLVGIVGYNAEKKIITIAYRCTLKFIDMHNNLKISRSTPSYLEDKTSKVHNGFLEIFDSSRPSTEEILKNITKDLSENEINDLTILVTGYSLGGATASIAASYWRDLFPKSPFKLTIFGAPKAANENYNQWLKKSDIATKSFVRKTDITPNILPSTWGLALLGDYIELSSDGDWSISWPKPHDIRKYQLSIYKALGLEEDYQEMLQIQFGKSKF